jgi:hypothetical protein
VSEPAELLVFVDEQPVRLPLRSSARAAVGARDATLEQRVMNGTAYLTDGRGIRLDPESPLASGAIVRVILRAPATTAETDAHT